MSGEVSTDDVAEDVREVVHDLFTQTTNSRFARRPVTATPGPLLGAAACPTAVTVAVRSANDD
jgi:hypothetical protein